MSHGYKPIYSRQSGDLFIAIRASKKHFWVNKPEVINTKPLRYSGSVLKILRKISSVGQRNRLEKYPALLAFPLSYYV